MILLRTAYRTNLLPSAIKLRIIFADASLRVFTPAPADRHSLLLFPSARLHDLSLAWVSRVFGDSELRLSFLRP